MPNFATQTLAIEGAEEGDLKTNERVIGQVQSNALKFRHTPLMITKIGALSQSNSYVYPC